MRGAIIMSDYILEMVNITKEFPGVKALDNVNFKVKRGEVHALCGENGAGKSTLMKVLSGVYPFGTYQGDIILNGGVQKYTCIKDSEKSGIGIIYQELALVKQMNICENIFLGNEIAERGVINWDMAFVETKKLLDIVGIDINPATKVLNLGIGHQQMVEIAKAISKNTSVLILDEPSAALTESETDNLLRLINQLKEKGVTCIYISHKLNEVFRISDSITVLRDGKTIGTYDTKDLNEDKVISLMVGREMTQLYPRIEHKIGEVIMEVKNWTVRNPEIPEKLLIDNVSLCVKKGEILGIAGLMGAGRTELFTSIFGVFGVDIKGQVYLNGDLIKIKNPKDAIKVGISYLSEDRKRYGLNLIDDIKRNISLASLDSITNRKVVNANEEIKHSKDYVDELKIKTPSIEQITGNLSGGNQQKVVLAKWLLTKPKVLILDEPTRGIDVGAKYEIYNIINQLAVEGVSIIMISSELPEILGVCDRVLVMNKGRVSGDLDIKDADSEKIMLMATGGVCK
jgi:ABC-type sugar transport system ATPase subunit